MSESTPKDAPPASTVDDTKEDLKAEEPKGEQATAEVKTKKKKKKGKKKTEAPPEETKAPTKSRAAEAAALAIQAMLKTPMEAPHDFKFWKTQPVPALGEKVTSSGPIEVKTLDQVSKTPLALPTNFEWCTPDLTDAETLEEIHNLLLEHYVEDDDGMFRFAYSKEFLLWALRPPGGNPDLMVGVRSSINKKLVAFVSGIPANVKVTGKDVPMVEINYLCVHRKLRSKRLAPVLIMEITRRVNLTGVWQAVYTAGRLLPKPVAVNRYYHRSLNVKKLIDIGFSHLPQRVSLTAHIKLLKVPDAPSIPGLRKLEEKDCKEACTLLNNYLAKFKLTQRYTVEEFTHWFITRPGIVYTWVVEDPASKKITDMFSFFDLPSSIIGHPKHTLLRAAYSFYNVATKHKLVDLMTDALTMAKKEGFDVFNALDVMDNAGFMKPLKFGEGNGRLRYYLYNWNTPEMQPSDVALVLF